MNSVYDRLNTLSKPFHKSWRRGRVPTRRQLSIIYILHFVHRVRLKHGTFPSRPLPHSTFTFTAFPEFLSNYSVNLVRRIEIPRHGKNKLRLGRQAFRAIQTIQSHSEPFRAIQTVGLVPLGDKSSRYYLFPIFNNTRRKHTIEEIK